MLPFPLRFSRFPLAPVRDGDLVVDDGRERADVVQRELAHEKVLLLGRRIDDDDKVGRVAVAAQQARERKRAYVDGLEGRAIVAEKRASELEASVARLEAEAAMLRKVIQNMRASA